MTKIIFFGNGPLADSALAVLKPHFEIIFHAKTREDLDTVKEIKVKNPDAFGVLASFGVIIKSDVLELFEPVGILNIHPSLLPKYRGPSPIETAILDGATEFSVSIMKLAPAMDAGPIYFQTTLSNLPINKSELYDALASAGAKWLVENLAHLPAPVPQDDSKATYTKKLDKSMSLLTPDTDTAEQTLRKIIAFQGFPKAKYEFHNITCLILAAHLLEPGEVAPLVIPCSDGLLAVDMLQPENKKPMDSKSFKNGYAK